MPGAGDYGLARRRVREVLAGNVARGSASRPHEVVERVRSEWGIRTDVGSTAMWEMVGNGNLELSDDWYLSVAPGQATAPEEGCSRESGV